MKTPARLQTRFEAAFDNYLKLTELLRSDLEAMFESKSKSLEWRRNFVRAATALLEGHAHCLREMCAVGLRYDTPALTKKERSVIADERDFDSNDRIKLTLRAAYRLFGLEPLPDFSGHEWLRAQRVFRKRHRLMHPKRPRDLGMSDRTWLEMRRDIAWLMKQFANFLSLSYAKYGS
jgi:hypothetical protein